MGVLTRDIPVMYGERGVMGVLISYRPVTRGGGGDYGSALQETYQLCMVRGGLWECL